MNPTVRELREKAIEAVQAEADSRIAMLRCKSLDIGQEYPSRRGRRYLITGMIGNPFEDDEWSYFTGHDVNNGMSGRFSWDGTSKYGDNLIL